MKRFRILRVREITAEHKKGRSSQTSPSSTHPRFPGTNRLLCLKGNPSVGTGT